MAKARNRTLAKSTRPHFDQLLGGLRKCLRRRLYILSRGNRARAGSQPLEQNTVGSEARDRVRELWYVPTRVDEGRFSLPRRVGRPDAPAPVADDGRDAEHGGFGHDERVGILGRGYGE